MPKLEAAWLTFQKAGVLAVITAGSREEQRLNAHDGLWGAKLFPLPAAESRHGRREADPAGTASAARSPSS